MSFFEFPIIYTYHTMSNNESLDIHAAYLCWHWIAELLWTSGRGTILNVHITMPYMEPIHLRFSMEVDLRFCEPKELVCRTKHAKISHVKTSEALMEIFVGLIPLGRIPHKTGSHELNQVWNCTTNRKSPTKKLVICPLKVWIAFI